MKKFVKAYVNGNEALINISAIAAVIFYDDGASLILKNVDHFKHRRFGNISVVVKDKETIEKLKSLEI